MRTVVNIRNSGRKANSMTDEMKIQLLEAENACLKKTLFRTAWISIPSGLDRSQNGVLEKVGEQILMTIDEHRYCDEPEFVDFSPSTIIFRKKA